MTPTLATSTAALQTVQSIYDAFSRGDIATIISLVAPGAVWRESATLPWGGDYSGPEGAATFFSKLDAAMETISFAATENVEVDGEVHSFGYYEGKGRKSGRTGRAEFMFRWKVANGKVISWTSYIDTAALLSAL